MFKYLNNNKGVALLTVMAVMSVLVAIGGIILCTVSSESKIIYDYGNNTRAFYIAEAGADYAIKEWDKYIDEKYANETNNELIMLESVSIDEFIDEIEKIENVEDNDDQEDILSRLVKSYKKDNLQIKFETDQQGFLANSVDNENAEILTIAVTGTYDGTAYEYHVQLWFYWDGSISSYKGLGTPVVADEPNKPDDETNTDFAIITNHLFTSHLRDFTGLFNDAPHIVGNVLIGPDNLSDSFLTYGTDIEGDLYVYDNLIVMGGFRGLLLSFDTNIKGNLIVQGRTTMYKFIPDIFIYSSRVVIGGNFYHQGDVIRGRENIDVYGQEEQRDVEIPQPDIHQLINNDNETVNVGNVATLRGKSYQDVNIVANKGLILERNFKGSGVIYVPNGVVLFEPGSEFTGTVISKYLYLFHDVEITGPTS